MVRPDQPAIPADVERRSDAETQADVALAARAMRQPFHRRAGVLQSRPRLAGRCYSSANGRCGDLAGGHLGSAMSVLSRQSAMVTGRCVAAAAAAPSNSDRRHAPGNTPIRRDGRPDAAARGCGIRGEAGAGGTLTRSQIRQERLPGVARIARGRAGEGAIKSPTQSATCTPIDAAATAFVGDRCQLISRRHLS